MRTMSRPATLCRSHPTRRCERSQRFCSKRASAPYRWSTAAVHRSAWSARSPSPAAAEAEREARQDWWLTTLAEDEDVNPEFMASLNYPTARNMMSAPVITVGDCAAPDDTLHKARTDRPRWPHRRDRQPADPCAPWRPGRTYRSVREDAIAPIVMIDAVDGPRAISPHEEQRRLRELAQWYRAFAERAGNPVIWEARLRTAEELEQEADRLEEESAR